MKTTIQTEVMTFDELSDKAKQKARDWYLEGETFDWCWTQIKEDAETIGLKITSLDRDANSEGSFIISAIECSEAIFNHHGETCNTYKSAKAFQDAIESLPELPTQTDTDAYEDAEQEHCEAIDNFEEGFLRNLLRDYCRMLTADIEYQQSDEVVDETILSNAYTFTADGKRFG